MDLKNLFNQPAQQMMPQSTPSIAKMYGAPTASAPAIIKPEKPKYLLPDRGVHITDDDIEAMRPLIYGEVSNRDRSKKELEADVIFNTAINRAKEYTARGTPKSISEVVAMPNQYQAYKGKQYNEYFNPSDSLAMAKKQEVDDIINNIHEKVKAGQYPDTTQGAYFYVHDPQSRIIYDNKRQLFAKK